MAPKGSSGGRSGSSSSSSSSGGSIVSIGSPGGDDASDVSSSEWTEKMLLYGSHFTNRYVLAWIAMSCICLLVILVVAVVSRRIKNKNEPGRRMFGWYGWGLAWFALLVYWGLSIMDVCLSEGQVAVARIYMLVYILELFFGYATDTALLLVIYGVISSRLQQTALGRKGLHTSIRRIHLVVVGILSLLVLPILAFFIRALVQDQGSLYAGGSNLSYLTANQLGTTWSIVYFVAAVEILGWAFATAFRPGQDKPSKRIGIHLLTLVAIPHLIRSTYDVATAIKYTLHASQVQSTPDYLEAIYIVFELVPHTIEFVGLLLIGLTSSWNASLHGHGPGHGFAGPNPAPRGHEIDGAQTQKPASPTVTDSSYAQSSLPPPPPGSQWVLQPVAEGQRPRPQELSHVHRPPSELQAPQSQRYHLSPPPQSDTTSSSPPISELSQPYPQPLTARPAQVHQLP